MRLKRPATYGAPPAKPVKEPAPKKGEGLWTVSICPGTTSVMTSSATPGKRLIITHNKDLNTGDLLIDDRAKWGADRFEGKWIQFGSDEFPDWAPVVDYLKARA